MKSSKFLVPIWCFSCSVGLLPASDISGTISYLGAQTGKVHVTAVQTLPGNKVLQLTGATTMDCVKTSLTNLAGSELSIQYWFRGSSFQSAVRQQSSGWVVAGWNGLHILANDGGVGGISAGSGITDGN